MHIWIIVDSVSQH